MSDHPHGEQATPDARQTMSLTTVLFGLILLALGTLWLLDVGDVLSVTWTLVGSVLLIVIGVVLLLAAQHGSHGGMIFLGIVLSVIVLFGSLASVPSFDGGVGDRAIAPVDVADLESEYNWGVGSQEIDLRDVELPDGETAVSIQMGTGDIEIRVPDDVAVHVDWRIGLGDAQVLERSQSGFSLNGSYESDGYDDADRQLSLEIQLGLGALEVRE